jgi:hypothetical protein
MGELLRGAVGRENQIPTEQVCFVTGLLKLVRIPGEPKANLGAYFIAGSAYAGRGPNIGPCAKLRKDVFEAVNTLLLLHLERSGHFCRNPVVSHRVRVHLSL